MQKPIKTTFDGPMRAPNAYGPEIIITTTGTFSASDFKCATPLRPFFDGLDFGGVADSRVGGVGACDCRSSFREFAYRLPCTAFEWLLRRYSPTPPQPRTAHPPAVT